MPAMEGNVLQGWALIITAVAGLIGTLITSTVGMIIALRTKTKVDAAAVVIEEVHRTTNSLTERLEASARKEGFLAGGQDEKTKASVRAADKKVSFQAGVQSVKSPAALTREEQAAVDSEKSAIDSEKSAIESEKSAIESEKFSKK
jgi:glutamate-1-semialdehyde aminotransferase